MTSGPSIKDSDRNRPRLPNMTVAPEVLAALRAHCRRTGATHSAAVERALRVALEMPSTPDDVGAKAIAALALRDLDAPPRETLRALFIQHGGNGARVAAELGLATAQPLMAAVDALGLREWVDEYRANRRT